jgi:protein-disulfide isomerase
MRTYLFANQPHFGEPLWYRSASELGLNRQLLEGCLTQSLMLPMIRADIEEGRRLGVMSTPTFFVGKVVDDGTARLVGRIRGAQPYAVFEASLRSVLASVR